MVILTNNNSYSHVQFNGTVKNTFLLNQCAKEYAKTIQVNDGDWLNFRMFVNTIKAIKNDGSKDEFWVDTLEGSDGKLWGLRYGEYFKRGRGKYNGKSRLDKDITLKERMELGREVVAQIIDFGIDYFGKKVLKTPIKEFSFIDNQLKISNMLYGKSKLPQNTDVSDKLIEKAEKAVMRAKVDASEKKEEVLNNL